MEAPLTLPTIETLPPVFWPDRLMGTLTIAVGLCYAVAAGASAMMGGFMAHWGQLASKAEREHPSASGSQLVHNGHIDGMPHESVFQIIGLILCVFVLLHFISGYVLFGGRKGGFVLTLGLATADAIFAGGFGIVVGLLMGVYAMLRMWGNVGPIPNWNIAKTQSNRL